MIIESDFREAWWLPGGHLQTLWPVAFNRAPLPNAELRPLELPDGDYVTLGLLPRESAPVAAVFHGLEGSLQSPYARRIVQRLHDDGFSVAFMHFRGCDGAPNRLARSYHSGDTGDIRFLLQTLRRESDAPIVAVGYSLGGNALLKYLGESGDAAIPAAAVAVCAPLQLAPSADRLNRGLSRAYQYHLVKALQRNLRRKERLLHDAGIDLSGTDKPQSFWQFDNQITAPLHGFLDARDYYRQSSARQFLPRIERATLIVQARNDPFMPASVLPKDDELSESVTLEVSRGGGHVGFVAGATPQRPRYWLDDRISGWLRQVLAPEGVSFNA